MEYFNAFGVHDLTMALLKVEVYKKQYEWQQGLLNDAKLLLGRWLHDRK